MAGAPRPLSHTVLSLPLGSEHRAPGTEQLRPSLHPLTGVRGSSMLSQPRTPRTPSPPCRPPLSRPRTALPAHSLPLSEES